MPPVGDRLAVAPSELVPHPRRQRLGREDQRPDRGDHPAPVRQLGGVALGRLDDDVRADVAVRRPDQVRLDRRGRRPLVQPGTEPLGDMGETANEARRLHGGAVRSELRTVDAGCPDPRRRLGRVEPQRVRAAGGAVVLDLLSHPLDLRAAARQCQRAALRVVRVDVVLAAPGADRVDLALQRAAKGECGVAPVFVRHPRPRRGEQRRTPAAVASGRAPSGDLPLDHDDTETWLVPQQVVRRPEPGEARADDGHVALGRTGQRRAGGQVVAAGLQPHRRQRRHRQRAST